MPVPVVSWSGIGKHLRDVSRSMDDAMNQDSFLAHRVEDKIIFHHKEPIAQAGQLVVVGYSSQIGMGGKPEKVLLDTIRQGKSGCDVLARHIRYDFLQVLFGDRKEANRVFTRTHECASGGLA